MVRAKEADVKVTREHRAYLRRRIAPLDTDTRRGSTWLGTTRGYTDQQLDTALRAVVAPLSPAVPDDGDVIAKRGRTSGGRAVETHVATADRTELTT